MDAGVSTEEDPRLNRKKIFSKALSVLIWLAFGPASFAFEPLERFEFDSKHTLPLFEVNHLGFSTQRGRFDRTSGQITLDRADRKGQVSFVIDAQSINMGSEVWNEKMRSADFFDTARFPEIRFESDRLIFEGDRPVAAEGTLTLLGVHQPIRLEIRGFTCGENPILHKPLCAADIEASLKRSAFGLSRYIPEISDEVRVLVPVEAFRLDSKTP